MQRKRYKSKGLREVFRHTLFALQVSIDSYEDVPENSESDLAKAVSQQPVSVAICASSLQFYSSGEHILDLA